MKIFNKILFTLSAFFVLNSCSDDLLEPTLADVVTIETYIYNEADLRNVVNGIYRAMSEEQYWGRDYIIFGELRADNVFANGNSGRFTAFGDMNYTSENGQVSSAYEWPYKCIAFSNIAIDAVVKDPDANQQRVNHIKGEAYAARALAHFDLLRLFGQQYVNNQGLNGLGVPYITKFKDGVKNMPRLTAGQTKQKIYEDLDKALSLMNVSFNNGGKFQITTHAVNAIKARVATYFGDTSIALQACQTVINSGLFTITPSTNLVNYWNASSAGAGSIFELAQVGAAGQNNGIDGISNIYRGVSYGDIQVINGALPANQLLADAEFESTDIRVSPAMIATQSGRLRNVGKFPKMGPSWDNWIKVLRYEEVILNYAEALLVSNPTQALIELNKIPAQRNATLYSVANIDNILKERRKEFLFEGFRFDDLARKGKNIRLINSLEQTHGGVSAGSYKYAFPIPQRAINTNAALVQNFGYSN
jgi:hypothetical protein